MYDLIDIVNALLTRIEALEARVAILEAKGEAIAEDIEKIEENGGMRK